jgi:hypothetical protein
MLVTFWVVLELFVQSFLCRGGSVNKEKFALNILLECDNCGHRDYRTRGVWPHQKKSTANLYMKKIEEENQRHRCGCKIGNGQLKPIEYRYVYYHKNIKDYVDSMKILREVWKIKR